MRALLAGDAPLRGRASLELVVGPFDFRSAAEYWGLQDNPRAAFDVHALVGGTPGYLPLAGAVPRRGDVRSWAIEHVLLPTSPLHREGRAAVAEDAALGDRSLYWGLLAAVADARGTDRVIAIGETKATAAASGVDQLARLDHIVERLGERGAPMVKRILTARAGFTAELRRTAQLRPDVELVDLDRLYNGS
jgi:uncharacterized protein